MTKHISRKDVQKFSSRFDADSKNRLAMNAVAKNGVAAVALNRETVHRTNHIYSNLIETPEATNQEASGRCWLFAALNTLRLSAIKKLNLEPKGFELSQAYQMFWDKLEKGNFFLENIIETRDEPLDGRLVMWLLAAPIGDGGQWDMFVNLVEKYGVVPKTAMPESASSSKSAPMNAILTEKLREYASVLRTMHAQGAKLGKLREKKGEQMEEFYRILTIHLGRPPKSFVWEWRDKDKKFHRHGRITPQEFFEQYVGFDMGEMVCLINAPTKDKPYSRMYTVQYLGNVTGGHIVRYLNVDMKTLKNAAKDMIVANRAVWFGCDVGKMLERDMGVIDPDIFEYDLVFGTEFRMNKATRLDYGHSRMTHAMVLTGVDLDASGRPLKWRVENSWGDKSGDKGFFVMSDKWFDEYLYEVMVSKKFLSPELRKVIDTEPIVLPPWDPMGSLALAE